LPVIQPDPANIFSLIVEPVIALFMKNEQEDEKGCRHAKRKAEYVYEGKKRIANEMPPGELYEIL
jgi:hypothetical protein